MIHKRGQPSGGDRGDGRQRITIEQGCARRAQVHPLVHLRPLTALEDDHATGEPNDKIDG